MQCLYHEIGTDTDITEQQEHKGSNGEAGGKAAGFAWRTFAGFCLVLALLLSGGALVWFLEDGSDGFSRETMAGFIKSWGIWGHFGVIGMMVAHSFIPFPAEFVAIAAGMSFGVVWGTVLTWTGAMIGGLLAFGIARKLGRPFVTDMLTLNQLARIDKGAAVTSVSAMIGVRLVPVIAFNLVNYGAGLTNVNWWRFTWTTAIGILPLTFLMAMIDDQMREPTFSDRIMLLGAGVAMLAMVHLARRFGVAGSDK
ncbi:MAG: TVP38/TMEM64 family protein [Anderseniella sp.]|nr:TVP38/TMEM64 family protein [Anderseniella sp.]